MTAFCLHVVLLANPVVYGKIGKNAKGKGRKGEELARGYGILNVYVNCFLYQRHIVYDFVLRP